MLKILVIACIIGCSCWRDLQAQARVARIYGEITTVMNEKIRGYITWGKSLYWTDIFTARKIENPYMCYRNIMGNVRFSDGQREMPVVHEFSCRFGNIRSIRAIRADRIELGVKGGNLIELDRARSAMVGNTLSVERNDGRTENLIWDHISEIMFMAAPDSIMEPKDQPITGIVETPYGVYKGIVQWDQDENSLEALLDGRMGSSMVSVVFKNIRSIESLGNTSRVTLHSGRELLMWGENDVNASNRGIVINMPSIGRVVVKWQEFKNFKSLPAGQVKFLSYDDFVTPVRLNGLVETRDGRLLEGVLVYDLDEAMDFELLDGRNGNLFYRIPFKSIREIEPKNYKYTWLRLAGGGELVLGGKCDVTSANDGVLVFRVGKDAVYIRWRDVKRILLWTKASEKRDD